jgi:hypothetical protein
LCQAETREAQEAALFSQYNAALLSLADGHHEEAGRNLREIVASPLFHKENNEEPLAKSLRYNVHKAGNFSCNLRNANNVLFLSFSRLAKVRLQCFELKDASPA